VCAILEHGVHVRSQVPINLDPRATIVICSNGDLHIHVLKLDHVMLEPSKKCFFQTKHSWSGGGALHEKNTNLCNLERILTLWKLPSRCKMPIGEPNIAWDRYVTFLSI
jgi:hypothetical protein